MNIKREILALGVRLLADKTSLVHKPDPFTATINSFLGLESYDQQIARKLEVEAGRAVEAAKTAKTNYTFKKLTKNI